jgi:hypothetical protein
MSGRLVTQAAVQPLVVIVDFDVLEELPARFGLRREGVIARESLGFQRAEERFGRRVLIAVAPSAHARLHAQ